MSADTNASNLSIDEERALAHVLDEIIPRSEDRRLPSAGLWGRRWEGGFFTPSKCEPLP